MTNQHRITAPRRAPLPGCGVALAVTALLLVSVWIGLWLAIVAMTRP
jgi:hypothetical protein